MDSKEDSPLKGEPAEAPPPFPPLSTGDYVIASMNPIRPLGIAPPDGNRSLNPKQVLLMNNLDDFQPWNIIQIDDDEDGNKVFRILLGEVGAERTRNGRLVVSGSSPDDDDDLEPWIVTVQPQHGYGVYTIESKDRSIAWTVSDTQDKHGLKVMTQPLIKSSTENFKFQDKQLFAFARVPPEGTTESDGGKPVEKVAY
ncbi:hypothetical protein ABW20_dc0102370 [Dactylellina cionopaga]|nr:hypothetical protein ABW20_dc0102370 [Dactylellina cionopaga]